MKLLPVLVAVLALTGCAERVLSRDQLDAMRPMHPSQPTLLLAIRRPATTPAAPYPSDDEGMLKALQGTHLFKEVAYEGETHSAPDYILEIAQPLHDERQDVACGEGLLIPIITVGIIPMTCSGNVGLELSFVAADGHEVKQIHADYVTRTWAGIVALFLLPSDSWQSWPEAGHNARFYEMAAYKVYEAASAPPSD